MTRTELILRELEEVEGDPAAVDAVFRRHADSKGPLYKALAMATEALRRKHRQLAGQVEAARRQLAELAEQRSAAERALARARHELTGSEELLREVRALREAGLTASDLACWHRLLREAGLGPEELAADLQAYGDLKAVCRQLRAERDRLQQQKERLEAALRALRRRKGEVEAALTAVEQSGLRRVKAARDEAGRDIRALQREGIEAIRALMAETKEALEAFREAAEPFARAVRDYRRFIREAAELEQEVQLARALRSRRETDWREVPVEVLADGVRWVAEWARACGIQVGTQPPDALIQAYGYPLVALKPVPLRMLAEWLEMALVEQRSPPPR